MLHCKYHHCFVINIIIISFVIPHCKYYHHSIIHVIHHFIVNIAIAHCKHHHLLTVCPFIVKLLDHIFALNLCHYSLSYFTFYVKFQVESFQPYPSRLMCWCLVLLLPIFTIFVGWCPLALVPGGWNCIAPLFSTGILLGLLIGRGVAAGPNVL